MIEKLIINSCATYTTECHIENLNKINFIYGANGSGKTTISNLIRNPSETVYSSSSIIWKNNTPIDTLVYNKRFRDENFSAEKINGIFTLGKATKDEIELIEAKTQERTVLNDEIRKRSDSLKKLQQQLEATESEFKNTIWTQLYKKYEYTFKDALRGSLGSKGSFKDKILTSYSPSRQQRENINKEILIEKYNTIFSSDLPTSLQSIPTINYEGIKIIEENKIWGTVIIGKSDVEISGLIKKFKMDDWVNKGMNFIYDEICPFCQEKTITKSFKEQLEEYFDNKYIQDLETIKALKISFQNQIESIINLLLQIENEQKNNPNTKLKLEQFNQNIKDLIRSLEINLAKIENKINEPSRKIELENYVSQFDLVNQIIIEANNDIQKHNLLVTNYATEKAALTNDIWHFLTDEYSAKIDEYLKKYDGQKKGIEALKSQVESQSTKYREIDNEIIELSKNLTDIQPTINEINKTLKYYGFLNFQIKKAQEDGYYQIYYPRLFRPLFFNF